MWKLFWFLILCSAQFLNGYKILVVYPFPNRSHSILGYGMVKRLLEAGHKVTYITPLPEKDQHPNFRQVDVSENFKYFSSDAFLNLQDVIEKQLHFNDVTHFYEMFFQITKATIENENIQKLMKDPKEEFDLIIVEWMFSELLSGLSAVFNCPYVWFSSMEPHWQMLKLIDEAPSPAYNTDILSLNTAPLSFTQRLSELYTQIRTTVFKEVQYGSLERKTFEESFGPIVESRGRSLPPWEEVKYNASLILGNSHVSMGAPTRLPQNFKPIGGYHIDDNVKPLPENLKTIMDNSKHGVIYFSMGSNLKSTDLSAGIKKDILKVFEGLKQTIIWKFEEEFPNLPKNVHVLKWAPQPSILAHPSCVLFITHGGLLSTTETIHYGVPIIGIPVFADQFLNVGRAVEKGFAKGVKLSYNLAEDLKAAFEEILNDPKYKNKAKELSDIYHHRPVTAGAELCHWVDHVVRTRGALHLRSPALMVPWYQKLYLDLAAAVLVIALLLLLAVKKIVLILKPREKLKRS